MVPQYDPFLRVNPKNAISVGFNHKFFPRNLKLKEKLKKEEKEAKEKIKEREER